MFLLARSADAVSGILSCKKHAPPLFYLSSQVEGCPRCADLDNSPLPHSYHKNWNSAALSLFKKVADTSDNHVISPHSIFETISLIAAGTTGTTLSSTLNLIGATPEGFHQYNRLIQSFSKEAEESFTRFNTLNVARGNRFTPRYKSFAIQIAPKIDVTEEVDFSTPELIKAFTSSVNNKVCQVTDGMIKECIGSGDVDSSTEFIIVNACLFKGKWGVPFENIQDAFKTLEENEIQTPMLKAKSTHISYKCYVNDSGDRDEPWQAVGIPYQDGTEMVIILPPSGIAPSQISPNIFGQLQSIEDDGIYSVHLVMPEYVFDVDYDLEKYLKSKDPDIFSDSPDFSEMLEKPQAGTLKMKHKVRIETNKEGTRAAASSTGIMFKGIEKAPSINIDINRPFLFLIRDKDARDIQFIGQVCNPAGT
ncbi:serpin family protein [Sansalvadorimonas sp. 2012CJ34-2]|uniref:Serpin family protein n=1 Tax=Parendozoicomonas callyspongiae TaxID=2942213 RepID=A0ABT0PHP8_9GAMM|nr:serpin family protein [Sansalvadorimonas sp. 2012CJ34-2]